MKGRGINKKISNSFEKHEYSKYFDEGIDDYASESNQTNFLFTKVKSAINTVTSPDVPMEYSLNPYQGCEHGCSYCYARNSHEYWGYNAGVDFEKQILIKENIVEATRQQLSKKNWLPKPIMLSGNTDCYQPIEQKLGLTRKLLSLFLEYKHPAGIITKNALIERDTDILSEMAKSNLVYVNMSINTMNEQLRLKMEPRTSTIQKRLKAIEALSKMGVFVNVLIAPVIFGLNDHEIPQILKSVKEAGAQRCGYITLRLNGHLGDLFSSWLEQHYPERKEKVLNQVKDSHGGK